jgi:hypothetical protein
MVTTPFRQQPGVDRGIQMVTTREPSAAARGGTVLAELAVSFGGYYLLRALGVEVFWALLAPAIVVGAIAAVTTARRRRVDLIGALVLAELVVTICVSLATGSSRIGALRDPFYLAVAGLFALVTLLGRRPLSHTSTASVASAGDPVHRRGFEQAWEQVPSYRNWQRALTAAIGLILLGSAAVKAIVIITSPAARIAHAVNVSNTITLVMIAVFCATTGILIQPPRRVVDRVTAKLIADEGQQSRGAG